MKYIVLSFDDGRKDFYTNALPILKKYKLPATLNVIPDFLGRDNLSNFNSADNACISLDELRKCVEYGIEIGNHSANHTNNLKEIIRGARFLSNIIGTDVGFASPSSVISNKNFSQYSLLLDSKDVMYIRSGNQVKRDGYFYAVLYIFYKISKSKILFSIYNRRNVIDINRFDANAFFYPSITCNNDNTIDQILYFIDTMPDEHAVIIMLHSILKKFESGYGKDKWFNSIEEFDLLCQYLKTKKDISVVTNKDLHLNIIMKKE